jgi:hypothetical protein
MTTAKKKQPKLVAPTASDFQFECRATSTCCALQEVGDFTAEEEHWDDNDTLREIDWKLPLSSADVRDLKSDMSGPCWAVTIRRHRSQTRDVSLTANPDQAVANIVLPQLGFVVVRTFKGKTGNTLNFWFKDK